MKLTFCFAKSQAWKLVSKWYFTNPPSIHFKCIKPWSLLLVLGSLSLGNPSRNGVLLIHLDTFSLLHNETTLTSSSAPCPGPCVSLAERAWYIIQCAMTYLKTGQTFQHAFFSFCQLFGYQSSQKTTCNHLCKFVSVTTPTFIQSRFLVHKLPSRLNYL